MPRKTRRMPSVPTARRQPPWAGYLLTALIAAALGAGVTYAALRQKLDAARHIPGSPSVVIGGGTSGDSSVLAAGNTAFDHQDWPNAIADYTRAIAIGQDNPDVRTDLGTAYRALHQPQQALEQYAAAQRENPHHENSLLNQGIVYAFDLHDTARAVSLWQQYLTRFPQGRHVADVKHFLAVSRTPPTVSAKQ